MKLQDVLPYLPLLASVNATPKDDLTNLAASITSVTNALTLALNDSAAVNTSDMVQSIGYQMGASMANMGCNDSPSPSDGVQHTNISSPYQNYTNSLSALSTALISRGHVPHSEPYPPVNEQIRFLTRAIYDYATCLRAGGYITQSNVIDTWTASGEILEAEVAWVPWEDGHVHRERRERQHRRDSARAERVRRRMPQSPDVPWTVCRRYAAGLSKN